MSSTSTPTPFLIEYSPIHAKRTLAGRCDAHWQAYEPSEENPLPTTWHGTKVRLYDNLGAVAWGILTIDQIDDNYVTFRLSGPTWSSTIVDTKDKNPPVITDRNCPPISKLTLLSIPKLDDTDLGIPWWRWAIARAKGMLNMNVPMGLDVFWAEPI
ncbi:hypothetical protein PUNSTDRAFT_45278 [Punctularia strigosozonata HHB-11173 SS5]|uniref:uncharacterized protein n=1 Tax=Punctularia strigosozonata (strain HHB-11173) TaxID=741275 RepID=UPI0004416ABC|nr:uncharacterized protein PUNSTDRAFT_45278 [Punctularia strigosozonata HHB-11173 SS5]EIN07780.1 hypothetical protein PUNSTDRAFT_45278 [Punctularia strigosozonata HHB-11173 SS5]